MTAYRLARGLRFWIYTIGHANEAPPREWLAEWDWHVSEMWFPRTKRPSASTPGDRAVIYASRRRGFIGAVEVIGHQPEPNPRSDHAEQFPWTLEHRLLVSKACDDNVASPESVGINPRRIQRGPHTEIDADEDQRAVGALLDAAKDTAVQR